MRTLHSRGRRSSTRRRFLHCFRPLLVESLERRTLLAALAPPGLVSWYRAEGNTNDFADGNNGTVEGSVAYAPGIVSQAFQFHGSQNDAVNLGNAPAFDFSPTSSFSIEAWINVSALAVSPDDGQFIVALNGAPFPALTTQALAVGDTGNVFFQVRDASGNSGVASSPAAISLNTWHHIVGVRDVAAGKVVELYVDGVLAASAPDATTGQLAASVTDYIGRRVTNGTNNPFNGLIDEVSIYNRALSAAEVQSLFAAGSDGKATIVVNTSADAVDPNDGVTSLREAINQSNASIGDRDVIGFNIPAQPIGLVSHWSAEKSANDSIDGNGGVLENGATFAPGVLGQAFDLTAPGSYVQVFDSSNLRLGSGGITLDAWIKAEASTAFRTIIGKADSSFPYEDYELRINATNHAEFLATDCGTAACGGFTPVASTSIVADGTFHHVAGVRRTNGDLQIYVDGLLENTLHQAAKNTDSTGPLTIGGPSDGNDFKGLIDEAEVYHRELSDSEIKTIYQTGAQSLPLTTRLPQPVSWYQAEVDGRDSADGNDGTINGSVPIVAGKVGKAFSFDGNPANNVSIEPSANLDLMQFTVDAWIYPTSNSTGFVIDKEDGNGANFILSFGNGSVEVDYQPGNHQFVDAPPNSIPLNTWTHIAGSYDGLTSKQLKLYINGALVGTHTADPGMETPPVGQPTYIGARNNGTLPFHGLIDEVHIFNQAVTADQVQALYTAGASGNVPRFDSPVSLYRGEGNANDSADGNNGTLVLGKGSPPAFAQGIVGQAIHFDGVDDLLRIPNAPNLNPTIAVTLEAWVNPNNLANSYNAVITKSSQGSDGQSYGMWIASDGRVHAEASGFGVSYVDTAPNTVPLNTWTHLAAVITAGGRIQVYVNSAEQAVTAQGSPPTLTVTTARLVIGNDLGSDPHAFSGLIDEAAVYNVALTPAEIQAQVAAVLVPQSLVRTISPTAALPTINDSVIIDGYTQPGSSPNTLAVGNNAKLLIELNGTSGSGSAFLVNSPNNTFKGLVINRFPGASGDVGWGFRLLSAGNVIQGNYLGTNPAGDTAEPNRGGGVSIEATSQPPNTPSGNNLIGGATAAARNVILGGAQGFAIDINGLNAAVFQGGIIGGDGNTVQGNYIGTNAAGSAMLGKSGIEIFTKNNTIGGTTAAARNVMFSSAGIGLNLSESNASGNTIQGNYIGINATGDATLGGNTTGITLVRAPGNTIGGTAAGAGNVISGNSFGIVASDSDNLTIQGNLIGTNAAGTAAVGNNGGIALSGGNNSLIGGTTAGARNIISGSTIGHGVRWTTSAAMTGNLIQGNYIGTDITGTAPLKNAGYGIQVFGETPTGTNIIGGTIPAARNIISGNGLDGINLQAGNIRVQGNFIGTDVTGTAPLGNDAHGVNIFGDNNAIGATTGAANVIAFNKGAGVFVTTGANNVILGNSIFSNTGLGIDLGGAGVTANDVTQPADADTGANNLQNFPVIASAVLTGTLLTFNYSVPSDVLNSEYPLRVEFFKADADAAEGQTFIGSVSYTAAQAGATASPSITPAVPLAVGDKIVATATDGAGNTSEFSAAVTVQSCTTVINTDDSGIGSLRQAIICANAATGPDTISFDIPGDGVHTISPISALPTITGPVIIDGYTQPGASPNTNGPNLGDNAKLLIELNGQNITVLANGLVLAAPNSTVRGLVINRFTRSGITVVQQGNAIEGNFIGTTADGSAAQKNLVGVSVDGPNSIGGTTPAARNVISGNLVGINVTGTGTLIQGNFFGTDATGAAKFPFLQGSNSVGIQLGTSSATVIGGIVPGAGNVITGTANGIIIDQADGVVVQGNSIGTDPTGTINLGFTDYGVTITESSNITIGGTAPGAGNLIAFNYGGVNVNTAPVNVAILGNSIFQNSDSLGIDLAGDGPTPNDLTPTPDADPGPNNLQNFPAITYATRDAGKLKVTYTVPSDPANSTYPMRVEFFLPDVKGQGKTYLGSDMFTEADFTAGKKTATFATAAPIKVFDTIVATATDSLSAAAGGGPANTSEFSPGVTIVSPWKNLNPGRLRWDVNDDTFVSADDVVAIINYVNAKGSGLLPDDAANQKPYRDVDGDNNVVAMDVIDIINYINSGRPLGGEAEAPGEADGPAEPFVQQWNAGAPAASSAGDFMALLAADVAAQAARKRKS